MDDDDGPPPYRKGTVLFIQPHKVSTPDEARAYVPTSDEEKLMLTERWRDRVESVFRFPAPQPAQPEVTGSPKQLRVTRILAGGQCHGPQVVVCTLAGASGSDRVYVAKIYDPLYYKHPTERWRPSDPPNTLCKYAHLHYTSESAAYERIEANKQSRPGPCTADYFGSWCFQVSKSSSRKKDNTPPARPRERTVCLILTEYVKGKSMAEVATEKDRGYRVQNFERLNETCRLYVWSRLLEAETWLEHIGVRHADLLERNVMLHPPPALDDNSASAAELRPQVVIIDFDRAQLGPGTLIQGLPPSPIVKWWHEFPGDIISWSPEWWTSELPRRRRWLLAEFGKGNRGKYQRYNGLCDVDTLTEVDKDFLQNISYTKWR